MNQLPIKWNWLCHTMEIYTRSRWSTAPTNQAPKILNKAWKFDFQHEIVIRMVLKANLMADNIHHFYSFGICPLWISLNDLMRITMVRCITWLFRPDEMNENFIFQNEMRWQRWCRHSCRMLKRGEAGVKAKRSKQKKSIKIFQKTVFSNNGYHQMQMKMESLPVTVARDIPSIDWETKWSWKKRIDLHFRI